MRWAVLPAALAVAGFLSAGVAVPAAHASSGVSCTASPDPLSLSADPTLTITVTGQPLTSYRLDVSSGRVKFDTAGETDSTGTWASDWASSYFEYYSSWKITVSPYPSPNPTGGGGTLASCGFSVVP